MTIVSTPATSSSTRETRAARMGLGRLLDYHDNEAIREGVLEELNNDKHTAIRRDGVYIVGCRHDALYNRFVSREAN